MRDGFTLVEILVVLAIMGIVAMTSFINFGAFKEEENLKSTAADLQSYLRLAQSNAQTGVKCASTGGISWSLVIKDRSSIELRCQTQAADDPPIREWTLKNPAQIDSIEGIGTLSCSSVKSEDTLINPVTVTFSYLYGQAAFSDPQNQCLSESTGIQIKVRKKMGSAVLKTVTISKGGSIDVSK